MPTIKLSRAVMMEKLDSDDVIVDEITDHGRWAVGHTFIFSHEGKSYRSYYRVGATECQDESPWEYESEIECEEVEPYEKTVVDYQPVMEAPADMEAKPT